MWNLRPIVTFGKAKSSEVHSIDIKTLDSLSSSTPSHRFSCLFKPKGQFFKYQKVRSVTAFEPIPS